MISRTDTTILRGPATVTYNASVFYSAGPIQVRTYYVTFDIASSAKGNIDRRVSDILTEISFTPVGNVSATDLGNLFPHTACALGGTAVPASDRTLIVWPINGKEKITYNNAFVSKMPDLVLSATKAPYGAVTFTAFGTNNEAWSAATHRFTYAATGAFSDTSLSATGVKTVPYTAALGALSAPWNGIQTMDGWTISFDIGMEPSVTDDQGIFDYLYTDRAQITVRCKPVGISVADLHGLMILQDTGAARGMSILSKKQALVIAGSAGAITCTVNNMLVENAPHVYHIRDRVEDLTFVSTRNLTTGALDALFTVGVVGA